MHSLSNERRRARTRPPAAGQAPASSSQSRSRSIPLSSSSRSSPLRRCPRRVRRACPVRRSSRPSARPKGVAERIVVARIDAVDLLLPVKAEATHRRRLPSRRQRRRDRASPRSASAPTTGRGHAVSPRSSRVAAARATTSWTATATTTRPRRPVSTSARSPGVFVYAPADGKVTSVKEYDLLGRYPDTEIQITARRRSQRAARHHPRRPPGRRSRRRGDRRRDGARPPAPLPVRRSTRSSAQFTTDNGDHVQIIALRTPPELSEY